MRLRTGRKVGKTIYIQEGNEPSDNDRLIGYIENREWAHDLVASYNRVMDETAPPSSFNGSCLNCNKPLAAHHPPLLTCYPIEENQ